MTQKSFTFLRQKAHIFDYYTRNDMNGVLVVIQTNPRSNLPISDLTTPLICLSFLSAIF